MPNAKAIKTRANPFPNKTVRISFDLFWLIVDEIK
jgi:hypothetical protein